MGKGFMANKGLIGQDLGELIQNACQKQGLNVAVEAILNDSSACLLSQAYSHTSTRFGLILGTGFNVGAYLPISLIGRQKFGVRPAGWFDRASHVIVNTELSMFGHGLLPVTRWDQQLLDNHPRPEFQPLEYMASGMYLGEIARYALIEAIETTGLFGGVVPPSLNTPYGLATYTLSMLEADTTSDLAASKALFAKQHPSTYKPTTVDLAALRKLASYISMRSSALIAASLYALWDVRIDSHKAVVAGLPESSHLRQGAEADLDLKKTMVAFNGSVIENYPGYLASCQRFVDELVENTGRAENGSIELVAAKESSLLGAAVASACAKRN
jgi:hexokinase